VTRDLLRCARRANSKRYTLRVVALENVFKTFVDLVLIISKQFYFSKVYFSTFLMFINLTKESQSSKNSKVGKLLIVYRLITFQLHFS